MNTTPEPPKRLLFVDPNREPVRPVDQVRFHPAGGSHLDITVLAFSARAVDETEFVNEPVITTRLRMNLTMAKGPAQGLSKQIAMAEVAKGTMS